MINGRTRLHVVANGTMRGQRYTDEVLLPHVRLFHGAVGDKFVFMDDNATCYRTLTVQDCLDSEDEEPKPRLPDSIARPITNMPLSRMENTTFVKPSITDFHDMELRTILIVRTSKEQRLFNALVPRVPGLQPI
ncbi:hypothetical protein TNCV_3124931 [Trichonephila clavipes]|nr:hypothetical protein TNCV_3124931 [Trichonephila clavipes]